MHANRFNLFIPLTGLLALGACGEEATPSQVNSRLEKNLPGLLDNTQQAMQSVSESELLAAVEEGMAAVPMLAGDDDEVEPLPASHEEGGIPSSDEVLAMLEDKVFNDDNYEGDGVYLLGPDLFCDDSGLDPAAEAECEQLIEDAEIRIEVDLVGAGGANFTLLIGPDRAAPLTVELRESRISLVGDLDEGADAAEHLASISGESIELPEVFEGTIAASLIVHNPGDVSIELAVREAIAVQGDIEGSTVSASLGASDPTVAVRANANAKELTVAYDVGRMQLSAPWHLFDDATTIDDNLEIDWSGASASVTLSDSAQSLIVENVGLGDDTSTVKIGDTTIFSVDLNADSGRRVTTTVSPTDALPTFTVDPELDLDLYFDLSLFDDGTEDVPPELMGETYSITLDGSMPTVQPVADELGDGGLRVVSGQLSIGSSSGDSVTVGAGECLLAAEPAEGDHPIIGALAAGPCP